MRYDDGPPRKRINRGLSEDVPNIPRSPPEIRRIGHRRHILAIGPDVIFLSSVGVQLLKMEANRVEFKVGGCGREVVGGISLMLINGLHSLRITVHDHIGVLYARDHGT